MLIIKGAQAEVLKIKELKSGETFAGKFYFSNDPELIQQVVFHFIMKKSYLILNLTKYR